MANKIHLGMRGHDFKADSLKELAEKMKQHKIEAVQLVLHKSVPGFEKGRFSVEYAIEIGEEFKKNNIKIPILGCYINPSDTNEETLKESLDYFVECLHYAKILGADMVGLETGFYGGNRDFEINNSEEAYNYLYKNMRYLCDKAEEIGVNIGIEGVHLFVINSPDRMKRLIDHLNSPNVYVIFDPVNYINSGNYKNQDEIINRHFDLLGNKTKALHFKDFKICDGEVCYEFPCKGILNKELIFKRIKELKNDVAVIFEETPEEKLPEVLKDAEKFLK